MKYRAAFCSLNNVITQLSLDSASEQGLDAEELTVIDADEIAVRTFLKRLILDVSDKIATQWQRSFVPFVNSYTVYPSEAAWCNWVYENGVLKYRLWDLDYADLLSLSSVVLDGTTLSASDYRLEGNAPYYSIAFNRSNVTLPTGSSFDSSAVFTGVWGYHENPSGLWDSNAGLSLQGALNSSATSFVATAGTVNSFEIYGYIQIDSETLFVTDVDPDSPYTVTVERGALGTTAASHLIASTIKKLQIMPQVLMATRRAVIRLYNKKAEMGELAVIAESTIQIAPEDILLDLPKRWRMGSV